MFNSLKILDYVDLTSFNAVNTNGLINTTVKDVTSRQCHFFGFLIHNPNVPEAFVQCFFRPASEVVLGTTVPDFTIKVGSSGSTAWDWFSPINCSRGFSIAATTTETGSTANGTGLSGYFRTK